MVMDVRVRVGAVLALVTLRHRLVRIGGRRLASVTARVVGRDHPGGRSWRSARPAPRPATPAASLLTLVLAALLGGALLVGLLQTVGIPLISDDSGHAASGGAPVPSSTGNHGAIDGVS